MKRILMALSVATLLASTGCHHLHRQGCNNCNGPIGCRPCTLGWQRGGTDYQRYLSHSHYPGHHTASGPASAQVAYPYYTVRGPRDFLAPNPPSIGR